MRYLDRGIEAELRRRLRVESLVILEGARATGKTRLLQHASENGWLSEVRSFLDESELAAARAAPSDYIAGLSHGTAIDEAQLCESILLPLKQRIEDEEPGAFLLTGSTRLRRDALGGSDPLAGRTGSSLQLGPLTLGERTARPIQLVQDLFDAEPTKIRLGEPITRSALIELVAQPGLPDLFGLDAVDSHDRALAYVRQVTALPAFDSLDVQKVNQLATFVAGRTSTLVNISSYAGATETARATVENYLARLEEALLILRLRGWRRSKDKSQTDKSKIHFFDSGVATSLARMRPGIDDDHLGRLVETVVATEVVRQCGWLAARPEVYHWRRNDREEVDLVVEDRDGRVICIETKSGERVDASSFGGIDAFRIAYPSVFHRGFVFYSGSRVLSFGNERWAIPYSALRGEKARENDAIAGVADAINERRREFRQAADSQSVALAPYLEEAELQLEELASHLPEYESKVTNNKVNVALTIVHPGKGSGSSTQLVVVTSDREKRTISVGVPRTRVSHLVELGIEEPKAAISAVLASLVEDIATVLAELDEQYLRSDE